jgi:hypothetical protein
LKWSIGDHAYRLPLRVAVTMHSMSEPSTFLPSLLAAATIHWGHRFHLFLPALASFLVSWTATLDGTTLLLLGVTSLLPRIGRDLAASLLLAYWVVMLSRSSVVYLKMLLCAQRAVVVVRHACCSRTPSALAP